MTTDKTTANTGHTNPDAITGAPASHPGATGIGAASGATTGAVIGMVGGPVGAAIGAAVGGVVGGWIGHTAGEAHDPSDTAYWKDEYKNRSYYDKSADFDNDAAPAFNYGSTLASKTSADTTNATKPTFAALQDTARAEWDKAKGTSKLSFDQAKSAISDAYDRKLQLHEEQLRATKERVQTGEARIRKEVITENKTIQVPVEREELVIERHAVGGAASAGTQIESEDIRIPLSEERVRVEKDTFVTEEVSIGKKKFTENREVGGEVRKETLVVDGDKTSSTNKVTTNPGSKA